MLAVGGAAIFFAHDEGARHLTFWLSRLPLHPGQHWLEPALTSLLAVSPRRLEQLGGATFIYAGLFLTEGIGLLLGRLWAEWLTVLVTGSFLPLEAYELLEHARWSRALLIAVNIGVLLYLVARLRADRRSPAEMR